MGDQARGPHPALAGAPRRRLGGRGAAAGRQDGPDRRLRADLAARANASPTPSATSPEHGLVAPILGHVGDGNFHLTLLVDLDDAAEVKAAKGLCERLVERALAMDGTCTGEHGVGQGKMKYLAAEHGAAALAAMAAIKRALDPQDIMNPGKIVPLQ